MSLPSQCPSREDPTGSTLCLLEGWVVHVKVIFAGISKLTVLLCTRCFSCPDFSLLVPSSSHVPQMSGSERISPTLHQLHQRNLGLAGLVLWFPIANIQHGGVGLSSLEQRMGLLRGWSTCPWAPGSAWMLVKPATSSLPGSCSPRAP